MPFAQDLVNCVRLRVHPTKTFNVDIVSLSVQFDRLGRHIVSRHHLITQSCRVSLSWSD